MKKLKKTIAIGITALALVATSATAFASSQYNSLAEAVADISGRPVDEIVSERVENNKKYGEIASEAGKLEEFKAEALEIKKAILSARVAEGKITQEKADAIIKALEERQQSCDGTGNDQIGREMGAKFGANKAGIAMENGNRNSNNGENRGQGNGNKMGMGMKNGSCLANSN